MASVLFKKILIRKHEIIVLENEEFIQREELGENKPKAWGNNCSMKIRNE